jgi:hypothetical protein
VPWLALVLTLAAGLRLAHVLALRDTPWFDHLVVDPGYYDQWAQRLAAGDWLGERAFYMDPLYPYALAGLYRLFGRDLLLVRLVQVVLGVGSCWLVASIGTRVGGRRIGLVAALFALCPDVFDAGRSRRPRSGSSSPPAPRPPGRHPSLRPASGSRRSRARTCCRRAGGRARPRPGPCRIIAPALFLAGSRPRWRPSRGGTIACRATSSDDDTGRAELLHGNNRDNLSGSYGAPFLRMNPASRRRTSAPRPSGARAERSMPARRRASGTGRRSGSSATIV